MKKILSIAFIALTLSGCGNASDSSSISSDIIDSTQSTEIKTSDSIATEVTITTSSSTTETTTTVTTNIETTTETTESTSVLEPDLPFEFNDIYENSYYTFSSSTDWNYIQDNGAKRIEITPDITLVLWGAPTDLRYTNNKEFVEYWVNDANKSDPSCNAKVCLFGDNYYAKYHDSSDDRIHYVCINGEFVEFFDFYYNDEEEDEYIVSKILESVVLKKPTYYEMTQPSQVILPTLPFESYYYNYKGELSTTMLVTDVDYEYNGILKINITAQMTYNANADRSYGKVGYKVTNDSGLILGSGNVLFDKMSEGESAISSVYVSNIDIHEPIIITFMDAD